MSNCPEVRVHYQLVEAEDVKTSHLPDSGFQRNPAYGLENERRYHDEPGSQAKVLENAGRLDPAFLMESVDANHGAPVLDHEGNVLGGNGRAMSILSAERIIERFYQKTEFPTGSQEEVPQTPSAPDTDTFKKTLPVSGFAGVYSDILNHLRNTANETGTNAEEAQLAPM